MRTSMKDRMSPMRVRKTDPMMSIPMKVTVEKVPVRAETHERVLTETTTQTERMLGKKTDRIK